MLDNIFKSMADMIYFFEFIDSNSELMNRFGEDIEDLLGFHQGLGGNYKKPKYRSFARLIKSILGYHGPEHDEDDKFYFQRHCMRIMQHAVTTKVGAFTNRDKNYGAEGRSMINTHMFHATIQADYYANVLTGREDREPKRVIDF